jgi:DNA-binding transcriptional LysR family regulator
MSFQGTTRTDRGERSLAHAAPILDEWRRSDQEAKDASREV